MAVGKDLDELKRKLNRSVIKSKTVSVKVSVKDYNAISDYCTLNQCKNSEVLNVVIENLVKDTKKNKKI